MPHPFEKGHFTPYRDNCPDLYWSQCISQILMAGHLAWATSKYCTLHSCAENTVIFNDFSPKMTKVRPKYISWGSIQDGVAMTRIR